MQTYKWRLLLWGFLHLGDTGDYDDITIDEVSRHARSQTISAFIRDRFGKEIDVSVMEAKDWETLSEMWFNLDNAVDFSRKFGVRRKGISLLMAFTLECLQQQERAKEHASA